MPALRFELINLSGNLNRLAYVKPEETPEMKLIDMKTNETLYQAKGCLIDLDEAWTVSDIALLARHYRSGSGSLDYFAPQSGWGVSDKDIALCEQLDAFHQQTGRGTELCRVTLMSAVQKNGFFMPIEPYDEQELYIPYAGVRSKDSVISLIMLRDTDGSAAAMPVPVPADPSPNKPRPAMAKL